MQERYPILSCPPQIWNPYTCGSGRRFSQSSHSQQTWGSDRKTKYAPHAPPLSLCGDNAAMIAWAGLEHLRLGHTSPLDTKARPRWPLDPDAEKPHKSAKTSIPKWNPQLYPSVISTLLMPSLTNLGFAPLLQSKHSDVNAYQDKSFPFGRLIRRHHLNNGWHQIEIQIEKHNPQKFRINIGFVPEDGITHPHTGYCPPQDIWTGYLPEYACLL